MGVLAVVGLLTYGLISKGGNSVDIGQRFPGRTLDTLDGAGSRSIADYRGKWVLVNLWASWCTPCRQEAPALEQFNRSQAKNDFTVLGVDSKDLTDNGQALRRRVRRHLPAALRRPGQPRRRPRNPGLP